MRSILLLLGVALCGTAFAGGGEPPDIDSGRTFAEANCGRCHAVGAAGDSPLAAAPPFRTFPAAWPLDNLAEALAEGIVVGHDEMPEFELGPAQIDDLIAYIESLS